jgi:spermidine synthase
LLGYTLVLFSLFFFLSGFCSLVYQVVWLRVAMAAFGVTTALVSIVLSVFMAGLALGSRGGGMVVRHLENRPPSFLIALYGLVELAIGISGMVVIRLLPVGRVAASSYPAAIGWISIVMLPFCTCMGATFPVAMAGIRRAMPGQSLRSFSRLYLANVAGATMGTLLSAFVSIELAGFSRTVSLAAGLNAAIAIGAFTWAATLGGRAAPARPAAPESEPGAAAPAWTLPLLFFSGLASLAMEVVWTRQFVPFLGPVVYSFAAMLAVYLAATAVGSRIYRSLALRRKLTGTAVLRALWCAGCFALLPLLAADPRISLQHRLAVGSLRVLGGVGAFCGVLGFLTPMLVDRWSRGDPDRAGRAYAANALGCIVGPLAAGFVLLPLAGERLTLILLALPFFGFGLWRGFRPQPGFGRLVGAATISSLLLIGLTRDFETLYPGAVVRRDHTASVIAAGQGMNRKLLINGMGITSLTPITKMMVHLPLAMMDRTPAKVLVVCLGMGTSFRSALSWGAQVTVVELVPSVPPLMSFFHSDAGSLLHSPRARVIVDDGRRFLERTREIYDAIVIDPPPPVEAAGSSLLYSAEFYEVAGRHLAPGGVLQQWLPQAERIVAASAARALSRAFPYVRTFPSVEGWGVHFIGSRTPLGRWTAAELASRLPQPAVQDLLEWGPAATAPRQLAMVVEHELSFQSILDADPAAPVLTDDRPVNEYYFLRRSRHGAKPFVLPESR